MRADAQLETWGSTGKVPLDHALLNGLAALRFLGTHHNVPIVGPVGVARTLTLCATSRAGAGTDRVTDGFGAGLMRNPCRGGRFVLYGVCG